MSSTIRIRHAKSEDRAFVLGLLPRMTSFALPPWRTPEEVVAGDHGPLDAWFDHPTPGEAVLIADVEGRPAGYAYLVVLTDFFTRKTHAHLSVLAVAKDAEGQGVGSALIEASTAWARARGDDRITLNVFNGNERAQALYERHGYERETIKYLKQL